ncbi:response regulator [Candidatus Daviesbacteria bacterium]|nr:response regulator [Candidatus Daviesbacteria bacterium]
MEPQQAAKRILIIEDEHFIADLYNRVMTKAGLQVKIALNGKDGLELLEQENFDLLLLDILLPDMNGLEVLRRWKLKKPDSKMIILLLTNLGQDAVIKEGFVLGAQGYLVKASYTPDQVVTEVINALADKKEG